MRIDEGVPPKYKEIFLPLFIKIALSHDYEKYINKITDFLSLSKPKNIEYDDENLSDNDKELLRQKKLINSIVFYIDNSEEFFKMIIDNDETLKNNQSFLNRKKLIKNFNLTLKNKDLFYQIKKKAVDVGTDKILYNIVKRMYKDYAKDNRLRNNIQNR